MSASLEELASALVPGQHKWRSVRLADCCSIVSGGTPKSSETSYWNGDILWATPKDLTELDSKYISNTPRTITESGYAKSSANMLPAQSVLFSSRAPIGHVAINTVPMCTNQGFKSLVPDRNQIIPDYLYHWLRANKAQLQALGNGATFKEVSKTVISKVEIPLPPLEEQRHIAAILDKADALRTKRRETIAKLDQLLQSVFLEMFGDPVTNPKGWPVIPITNLVLGNRGIKAGPFGSALKKDFYTDSGYRVYGQEQVIAGTLEIGDYYIDENRYQSLKANAVNAGDILVSLVGSYGKVLIVPDEFEPGIINPRLLKIVPDNRYITSLYLAHFIQSKRVQTHLAESSHGGTMGILNASLVKQLRVPVPPLEVQNRYLAQVERMREINKLSGKSAKKLDRLFGSIQQRAFTGQL